MHLVFQFPIVDYRPLLTTGNDKLPYPVWPDVGSTPKRFIRKFGATEQRNAGGSDDWPGEGWFCNSHLAMRYDNLHKNGYEISPGVRSAIFNSYRRYSSAENFLGRVEAGFVDNSEKLIAELQLPEEHVDLEKVLEHYCDLAVSIAGKSYKLGKVGQKLADGYYRSSTPNKVKPAEKNKVVRAGDPVIVMVHHAGTAFKPPHYAFKVDEITLPGGLGNLILYGCRLKHNDSTYKVWIIEIPYAVSRLKDVKAIVRNLRINLLRIHLEKETVRVLLNGIKSKEIIIEPGSEQASLADKYFEQTGIKIFQETRYSIEQKNILAFALNSEDSTAPGSFDQLEEGIYNFKNKYVLSNINKLLNRMAKKMILFICASPKGLNPMDFGKEFANIQDALRYGTDRDNFDVEIRPSVKRADLIDVLNQYRPDYLHLSMHADLTEGLYFEDDDQEISPMPVDEFKRVIGLFSERHKPTGIILSACNSKAHAEAVKPYCNFAIGTQQVFPAEAGVLYAAKFYKTLFEKNGNNFSYCHKTAVQAIQDKKPPYDDVEGMPVYQIPVYF